LPEIHLTEIVMQIETTTAADMVLARRIGAHLADRTSLDPITAGKMAVEIITMLPGADQQPAGYLARQDLVKLGNCRAELWATPPDGDAVPVFLGAPTAPADVCAEMRALCSNCGGTGDVHRIDGEWMGQCTCAASTPLQEDPLDIVRTLLVAVDGYHSRTSAFEPSPIANNSPVIMAARRACVERGFTEGGLAIEQTGSAA
jgi:hypothetical protein